MKRTFSPMIRWYLQRSVKPKDANYAKVTRTTRMLKEEVMKVALFSRGRAAWGASCARGGLWIATSCSAARPRRRPSRTPAAPCRHGS